MDFTTFYTYIYHKHTNTFFTSFTKSPHIYENTTTPHDFTKNTGWGRSDNKKYPREFFALPLITHLRTITMHCSTPLEPQEQRARKCGSLDNFSKIPRCLTKHLVKLKIPVQNAKRDGNSRYLREDDPPCQSTPRRAALESTTQMIQTVQEMRQTTMTSE